MLWRSKNIYFILLGIKAFNECIIKLKKVYTALEIPLLSQAINIQGTIPSCDPTCFLFGLQPSYKSRYYVTTQPGATGKDCTPGIEGFAAAVWGRAATLEHVETNKQNPNL